mmetsp:Transcript_24820/g.22018  ORF Transcript_24820/g.22018 Transcript_24820/m.22018 type:complete len:95 (-) Transcript_24820:537-821(-)
MIISVVASFVYYRALVNFTTLLINDSRHMNIFHIMETLDIFRSLLSNHMILEKKKKDQVTKQHEAILSTKAKGSENKNRQKENIFWREGYKRKL